MAGRSGRFVVRMNGASFAGDLGSFIDRQAFLYGMYEAPLIKAFIAASPRRRTVLDVGANVGNHSVAFATAFERVIAFEPNPVLWPALEKNAALNADRNIEIHRIGLSDRAGALPFYNIDNGNFGLGTFLDEEQYDQPLRQHAVAQVAIGDEALGDEVEVDAIKIDVQGLEAEVLRGLSRTLARCRPIVWTEIGSGTIGHLGSRRASIEALFPYPVRIRRFEQFHTGPFNRVTLRDWPCNDVKPGDYLIEPAATARQTETPSRLAPG